ncbi:hypothetical protein L7F22_026858 [Adiantum nelumboides]|nr:hypothetical protein [Adiantum nelumboides]
MEDIDTLEACIDLLRQKIPILDEEIRELEAELEQVGACYDSTRFPKISRSSKPRFNSRRLRRCSGLEEVVLLSHCSQFANAVLASHLSPPRFSHSVRSFVCFTGGDESGDGDESEQEKEREPEEVRPSLAVNPFAAVGVDDGGGQPG